jgi:acyl-homoserine-lactone acylase
MGIVQVQDRLNGIDGLGGNKFSLRKLQEVGYSNRSYAAELVLDDVLSDCFSDPTLPVDGGGTIDGTAGCNALANWDRRNDVGSRGAHVFREFARNADFQGMMARGEGFLVPFDENDPVNTPRDLDIISPAVDPTSRLAVRQALGDAIKRFNDLGIALDEQLGVLQYEVDAGNNGERIPMHGGSGNEGVFNVLGTRINEQGEYTPATAGPTYMQTVTFDDEGPVAEALLAFSQSPDSTRPFHRDQTRRYSEENWIALPFSAAEVAAKAIGEPLLLSE